MNKECVNCIHKVICENLNYEFGNVCDNYENVTYTTDNLTLLCNGIKVATFEEGYEALLVTIKVMLNK